MQTKPLSDDALPTDPETWVDQHGDYLFRYALARLRDRATAEDLVQDTFLAALRGREQFAGRSSERTWLVAILKRKLIDHLRQRRRTVAVGPDPWADGLFDARGKWRVEPGHWEDAGAALERQEFWDVFGDCLGQLPGRLRRVFLLRQVDDRPSAEICQVLGLTVNNLWVMVHRARLRLWACLQENWFGEGAA